MTQPRKTFLFIFSFKIDYLIVHKCILFFQINALLNTEGTIVEEENMITYHTDLTQKYVLQF